MSDIKTWVERCEEHPDHQSGMISEGMIRARMCEEIDDLRAEVERLTSELKKARTEVENLYDQVHRWVDDRSKAQLQADRLRDQSYELQRQRDEALAEVERLRAEIERLYNEDTKTRHALKGWAFVCPDGGDEPTHERVAAVVAEVERLRADRRERIATAALQGILACQEGNTALPKEWPGIFAIMSVGCADALIAELDKEGKP